jgi:predicted NodU family carbamoyl transferase
MTATLESRRSITILRPRLSICRIVAAAQEERFSRKQTKDFQSKREIGLRGRPARSDLDYVGFYEKPLSSIDSETYLAYAPQGYRSFRKMAALALAKSDGAIAGRRRVRGRYVFSITMSRTPQRSSVSVR